MPGVGSADAGRPALSIVVASYGSAETIERCLASLAAQRVDAPYEVIVVDSGPDDAARRLAGRFPDVTLVRSEARLYPGAARNLGIAHARGAILGFVDADCVAAPDWAARVLAAHAAPDPVIGGVVDNGDTESAVGWALYFCEFHSWMPGTPAGPMRDIPTCCLSMKRWAFERFGPFRADGYCSDTAFHWGLARHGVRPRFDPAIRVAHIHPTSMRRFVRKQLMHGREFARVRVAERGFSPARRLAFVALAPGLPLLLAGRLLRRVVLGRRGYGAQLLAAFPLVLLGLSLWSLGEMRGYARPGPAHAPSKSQVSATMSA